MKWNGYMKIVKKMIKYSTLSLIIIFIFGFVFFGYTKLSMKIEIKNSNNVSLYDTS